MYSKTLSVFFVLLLTICACNNEDHFAVETTQAVEEYTYFSSGESDGHEYTDLGLSVMWATMNVGAENASESGIYVSWGEVEPKEIYSWKEYTLGDGTGTKFNKYVTDRRSSAQDDFDGLIKLEPQDDAAVYHWGGSWRMPTDEEVTELREKCKWTWLSYNGVQGYCVTGPNGNTIFLPANGYCIEDRITLKGLNGCFWTSTLSGRLSAHAYELLIFNGSRIRGSSFRYYGENIRPVFSAGE